MIKNLKNISRYLTLLLRHDPKDLVLDKEGYVKVEKLLDKLDISIDDLQWIVDNNDKKRFAFNSDQTMIRATQGHSLNIDLKMKRILPPDILFHGTSIINKEAINKEGLKKMNRNHVHLSDNYDIAHNVGMRYAKYQNKLWIIEIDAKSMNSDGYSFYKSENGVYLTDHVPSKYLNK